MFEMQIFKRMEKWHLTQPQLLKPTESVRVLVSGLTRGGTQYCRDVLHALGVETSHEAFFSQHGMFSPPKWHKPPVVEVSGLSAPWAADWHKAGVKIVHLLRHPLRCVGSNVNFFSAQLLTWSEVSRVYLRWHKLIDAVADHTIYLEHFAEGLPRLLELAGVETVSTRALWQAVKETPHGRSTPTGLGWSFHDLPVELQEYALSRGYWEMN